MLNRPTLKRYFIWTIVGSLTVSSLIGIFVVLFGSFGTFEAKVLATTAAIAVFGVTGLANIRNLDSPYTSYRRFALVSIGCSVIATLFTLSFIWVSVEHTPWRPTLAFFVLAFSTAHASLVLTARSRNTWLDSAVTITLSSIAFVAGFLLYLIVGGGADIGEMFYRILAVFAILDVLGTVVTPILARTLRPEAPAAAPALVQTDITVAPISPANDGNQPPVPPAQPPTTPLA